MKHQSATSYERFMKVRGEKGETAYSGARRGPTGTFGSEGLTRAMLLIL